MRYTIPLIICLSGCYSAPSPAPSVPVPFYKINKDLVDKSFEHKTSTSAMVSSEGLLCYKAFLPWIGQSGLLNYLRSHDLADAPAWHGMLMQALAYEMAAGGDDNDVLLGRMAQAFLNCFEITGQKGLLARSWIYDYDGHRRPWMDTRSSRPKKYWTNVVSGKWFRCGLAKNHLNMAMAGCGVPLALHRQGRIVLSASTKTKLEKALVYAVRRLVRDNYRIKDFDGSWTEFGDLRPYVTLGSEWPEVKIVPNGFNRMVVLSMLCSAAYLDSDLASLYEQVALDWTPGIESSMKAVGAVVSRVKHYNLGKPSYSDMQAFATAASVLLLQETRPEITSPIIEALRNLWSYMKFENNVPFSLALGMNRPGEARLDWVIRCLRYFPGLDGKKAYSFVKKETSHFQPIENRPPNTNYWKSSPFRLAVDVNLNDVYKNPDTGDEQIFSGADFLYGYWFGRYLGIVPME